MSAIGKNAVQLQAFLVWNFINSLSRLAKSLARTPAQRFGAYWQATRQRYEAWINAGPSGMGQLDFARRILTNSLVGDIFGAVIIVVLGSSLFGTVANFTTGITIAHAGFTVNPNITASVGFVPIIQLIPFVFAAMVLLMVYAIFEKHLPGGL
jgi:hypothetical protein